MLKTVKSTTYGCLLLSLLAANTALAKHNPSSCASPVTNHNHTIKDCLAAAIGPAISIPGFFYVTSKILTQQQMNNNKVLLDCISFGPVAFAASFIAHKLYQNGKSKPCNQCSNKKSLLSLPPACWLSAYAIAPLSVIASRYNLLPYQPVRTSFNNQIAQRRLQNYRRPLEVAVGMAVYLGACSLGYYTGSCICWLKEKLNNDTSRNRIWCKKNSTCE